MSGTTAPIPPISGNLTYNLYTGISTSTQMSTAPTLRSSSPNDTSTQMVSPSPPSPTQGTRATSRMASERGTCSRFAVPCTTHWFHLPPPQHAESVSGAILRTTASSLKPPSSSGHSTLPPARTQTATSCSRAPLSAKMTVSSCMFPVFCRLGTLN